MAFPSLKFNVRVHYYSNFGYVFGNWEVSVKSEGWGKAQFFV